MWATIPLLLALSVTSAEPGQLALTNVRATHGVLGVPRADNQLLPGDRFVVSFDIDGITVDENGKAAYSIGMEVANSQGKVLFKQEPRNLEAVAALGGTRLPAFTQIDVGTKQPPGDYTLKVTVTDRATGKSQTLAQTATLLPPGFGLVRLATTSDAEGQVPAPPVGVVGQSLYVNCGAVGFARNGDKQQPNLAVEMQVRDASGRPTVARPFTGAVNQDVSPGASLVPLQFVLPLNRPGKYTIEVKATDRISNKTAKLSFPYRVIEAQE
jgi:hypothetical protein